jgi:uncharacterized membrane protein YccF (DUF307 family)
MNMAVDPCQDLATLPDIWSTLSMNKLSLTPNSKSCYFITEIHKHQNITHNIGLGRTNKIVWFMINEI